MTMISSTLSEGLLISLFSVTIVFFILSLIALSIQSLKYIHKKDPTLPIIKEKSTNIKPFELSDIKDEQMLVAALVAAIDYYEDTKTDIRVISIKEITSS